MSLPKYNEIDSGPVPGSNPPYKRYGHTDSNGVSGEYHIYEDGRAPVFVAGSTAPQQNWDQVAWQNVANTAANNQQIAAQDQAAWSNVAADAYRPPVPDASVSGWQWDSSKKEWYIQNHTNGGTETTYYAYGLGGSHVTDKTFTADATTPSSPSTPAPVPVVTAQPASSNPSNLPMPAAPVQTAPTDPTSTMPTEPDQPPASSPDAGSTPVYSRSDNPNLPQNGTFAPTPGTYSDAPHIPELDGPFPSSTGDNPDQSGNQPDTGGTPDGSTNPGDNGTLQHIQPEEKSLNGAKMVDINPGDTLQSVAFQNNISVDELERLNPEYKNNPDLFSPGHKVILSLGGGADGQNADSSQYSGTEFQQGSNYSQFGSLPDQAAPQAQAAHDRIAARGFGDGTAASVDPVNTTLAASDVHRSTDPLHISMDSRKNIS